MIVAIDYDDTYTRDPETFNKIIHAFKMAGHTVICVTGRSANDMVKPVQKSIGKWVNQIVFAGKDWKRDAARNAGFVVDVWIDDSPEYVGPQLLVGQNNG